MEKRAEEVRRVEVLGGTAPCPTPCGTRSPRYSTSNSNAVARPHTYVPRGSGIMPDPLELLVGTRRLAHPLLAGSNVLSFEPSLSSCSRRSRRSALGARSHHVLDPHSQSLHALVFVAQLAAFALTLHAKAGWLVDEPHRGVGRVHGLTTRSTRPEDLHVALGKQLIVGVRQPVSFRYVRRFPHAEKRSTQVA